MKKCDPHHLEWDPNYLAGCPTCALIKQLHYAHLGDLRRCTKHNGTIFYDKDYGCLACNLLAVKPELKETPVENAPAIKTAKDVEVRVEAHGDHGRPEEGGAGYRWL